MRKLWLVALAASLAYGQDVDRILKGIEEHYNNISTLQVDFSYTYTQKMRKSTEKGILYLHKPKRMRWQFTSPEGNLFISDGDSTIDYDAKSNEAHKEKLKDNDDLRAPLAFLLGKLDFKRDFSQFNTDSSGMIAAVPKNNKLPYTELSFLPGPDNTIQRLIVKGVDGSRYDYSVENEKKNPPGPDTLFKFQPPPGVKMLDGTR
jgi:outer membrane lipoprotein carrier protein